MVPFDFGLRVEFVLCVNGSAISTGVLIELVLLLLVGAVPMLVDGMDVCDVADEDEWDLDLLDELFGLVITDMEVGKACGAAKKEGLFPSSFGSLALMSEWLLLLLP